MNIFILCILTDLIFISKFIDNRKAYGKMFAIMTRSNCNGWLSTTLKFGQQVHRKQIMISFATIIRTIKNIYLV